MSAVAKGRQASRWQLQVAWPQRKDWQENYQTAPCDCGCGQTRAVCLADNAVTGAELLANVRAGHCVLTARAREQIRPPRFRSTFAQPLWNLMLVECIDRGASAIDATEPELGEVCLRELGRGSPKSVQRAMHELRSLGCVVIAPAYGDTANCRKCRGKGKRGDGEDCETCKGTGKRGKVCSRCKGEGRTELGACDFCAGAGVLLRRPRTAINKAECKVERVANYYLPGPMMLAALKKAKQSAVVLMRQAELAAQAERRRAEEQAELERRAEKGRAAERRARDEAATERRRRVREVERAIADTVTKRPDPVLLVGFFPERLSVIHDRPESGAVPPAMRPSEPDLSEKRPPPVSAEMRAPLARAENALPFDGATVRPSAALLGVSLPGRSSAAPAAIGAFAPHAGPEEPEGTAKASGNPRPPDASKGRLLRDRPPAPPDDELPIEELVLRVARAQQRLLDELAAAPPGKEDG